MPAYGSYPPTDEQIDKAVKSVQSILASSHNCSWLVSDDNKQPKWWFGNRNLRRDCRERLREAIKDCLELENWEGF